MRGAMSALRARSSGAIARKQRNPDRERGRHLVRADDEAAAGVPARIIGQFERPRFVAIWQQQHEFVAALARQRVASAQQGA